MNIELTGANCAVCMWLTIMVPDPHLGWEHYSAHNGELRGVLVAEYSKIKGFAL